jgi:hypothetical protein
MLSFAQHLAEYSVADLAKYLKGLILPNKMYRAGYAAERIKHHATTIDMYLGTHWAKDPKLSMNYYGIKNTLALNLYQAQIPPRILVLDQSGDCPDDFLAFNRLFFRTKFGDDVDAWEQYLLKYSNRPKKVKGYLKGNNGTETSRTRKMCMLLEMDRYVSLSQVRRDISFVRSKLARLYDAIQYKDTAKEETEGTSTPVCYLVFEPSRLKGLKQITFPTWTHKLPPVYLTLLWNEYELYREKNIIEFPNDRHGEAIRYTNVHPMISITEGSSAVAVGESFVVLKMNANKLLKHPDVKKVSSYILLRPGSNSLTNARAVVDEVAVFKKTAIAQVQRTS